MTKPFDLIEVSPVTRPADWQAGVTGLKSYQAPAKPEFAMRDLARADFDIPSRAMTANDRN